MHSLFACGAESDLQLKCLLPLVGVFEALQQGSRLLAVLHHRSCVQLHSAGLHQALLQQ